MTQVTAILQKRDRALRRDVVSERVSKFCDSTSRTGTRLVFGPEHAENHRVA
jgi:hypothetical protein